MRRFTRVVIYPNTHFDQSRKSAILNGPYGSYLH